MNKSASPIIRTTLSKEVAERIEKELISGDLGPVLPGYRTLAKRYDVSWGTAVASLRILEQGKVITSEGPGRPRKFSAASVQSSKPIHNLLVLTEPGYLTATDTQTFMTEIERFWNQTGGSFILKSRSLTTSEKPTRTLRSLIEQNQADALLVCVASAAWIEAIIELEIPAYIHGGEMGRYREEITGSGYGLCDAVQRAVQRLHSLGHNRILVPSEVDSKFSRAAIETGLNLGSEGELSPDQIKAYCPIFRELVPSVWQGYWERAFVQQQPTAVVLKNEIFALSFYGFCARNCLGIPRDVSAVCFGTADRMQWLTPPPTLMVYPISKTVSHFKRWVRNDFRQLDYRYFDLKELSGESTSAPRS